MTLFDENNLIIEKNRKLVLIDPIKKTIKKEFKQEGDRSLKKMIPLNNNLLLIIDNDDYLYEYEVENNKLNLKHSKEIEEEVHCFDKYPDNQFIASGFLKNTIYIYTCIE